MADPIRRTIPLSIDVEDNSGRIIYEADSDAMAWFYRGNSIRFAVTLLKGGVPFDLGDVTKLRLVVKPLDRDMAPHPEWDALMLKEIEGPFVGNTVDVDFEPAESAIGAGTRWMGINLYDADNILTTAAGRINVKENGTNDHEEPPKIIEARDAAIQAAIDAELYRDQSRTARDESQAARTGAEGAASDAQGYATAAQGSATAAAASAVTASGFSGQAAGFKGEAEGFKNQAEAAALSAQQVADDIGDLDAALEQAGEDAAAAEAAALSASASAALVDPLRMARAGGITFDGVDGTNNSFATAPRPQLVGQAFSIAFVYQRHGTEINSAAALICTNRMYQTADGGWHIRHTGPGGNNISFTARSSGTTFDIVAAALADVAIGDWCTLGFDLDNSGDPNEVTLGVYVNGVYKGSATSVGLAPYAESSANLPLYFARQGATSTTVRAAMGLRNVITTNRLMTAQEHADFAASGGAIVSLGLRRTGMDYASDFATADGWLTNSSSSVVTANNTVGGESEVLTLTAAEPGSIYQCRRPGMRFVEGLHYRFSARVYVPSSNPSCDGVRLMTNTGSYLLEAIRPPMDTWVTVESVVVFPGGSNLDDLYLRMLVNTSGSGSVPGDSVSIKDVVVEQLGATMHFPCDDGNNYQCRNMISGGEAMLLSPTGVTHSIPRTPWTLSASRTGSGWIEGDRPMLSTGAEIEYASVTCSESGTVSLGYNSANGATHFTVAHPGGGARVRVPIADASPGVTDRRLYLTAPAGAVVSVNLSGNIR